MLNEGARIRRIAGLFDGGVHGWPSEEEKIRELAVPPKYSIVLKFLTILVFERKDILY
jgi:hypothetical protein